MHLLTRPPVSIALIAISIIVFVLMQTWNREQILLPLLISQYYQPALPEIQNGEIWRLITPIFLHFGIFHLIFNMLWTWELGKIIESRQGAIWLILTTLLIAVISNLAQYLVTGPVFGGMSGVIYGYLGYVWLQGNYNPGFGIKLNPSVVKLMLGWFLLCWSGLLEKFFGLSVANTAHTAGLVSGVVLGLALVVFRKRRI
ncbi:MAG: rhomboid family intramembrane serine protease [Gammaproteobacteria bacterium]|nr:rhomboid family intramembrane serine protease [Gammaproteobacteria bacterium]NKB65337.1 rhomboid family intramembrane serine protease [Gammaproteobacteria bacterium]